MTIPSSPLDPVAVMTEAIRSTGLQGGALKEALRAAIARTWPDLPPWTTLPAPVVEEVQKATVGCGVAVVLTDRGVPELLLGRAGDHYKKADLPEMPVLYTIPGGFINLTETPGSRCVAASSQPEDAAAGAAREVEEEFRLADGTPLIEVDPARLKPRDTKTLAFRNGEKRLVIGFMMELTPAESARVRAHVARLQSDAVYAETVAAQSINPASGLPEIAGLSIVTLDDAAAGRVPLLHTDQQSLFIAVQEGFISRPSIARPSQP